MHKKCILTTIAAVVIVGAGMFFAGMKYDKSKLVSKGMSQNEGNRFEQGQGQGKNRQIGAPGSGQRMGGGANNGSGDFIAGDIISKDDKSITVKTKDGGSKIIYFSDSTTIGKMTQGSSSDLSIGQQVMVNGKSSPDGSLAAQNVQIRPADQIQSAQ
jgi:hypothetical protein